jgi:hypothetical protein
MMFVVELSEFLAANPEVPGSNPGVSKFSRVAVSLKWVSLSLIRIDEEILERKVAALV